MLAMVHVCLYYAILSVPCSFVVTVGKGLALALLCVLFSCVLSLSSVSPMARLVPLNMFKPSSILTDPSKLVLLLCILFITTLF